MNEADIRSYAKLIEELGLTALEIDESRGFVRLERNPHPAPPQGLPPQLFPPQGLVQTPFVPEQTAPAQAKQEKGFCVNSPIVGIFYTAPMENAEPYVKVGDRVKKGDILCIVEAMKLMNEITAERDGRIIEICAENGQMVDYGYPLFKMED